MIRSAAKANISCTRSPSACFSTRSIGVIRSSVIVVSVVGFRSRNPNLLRRSAVTASVTHGRAAHATPRAPRAASYTNRRDTATTCCRGRWQSRTAGPDRGRPPNATSPGRSQPPAQRTAPQECTNRSTNRRPLAENRWGAAWGAEPVPGSRGSVAAGDPLRLPEARRKTAGKPGTDRRSCGTRPAHQNAIHPCLEGSAPSHAPGHARRTHPGSPAPGTASAPSARKS